MATLIKSKLTASLRLIACAAVIGITITACNDSRSDNLSIAESEIEVGNYASAQSLFDELIAENPADTTNVERLCRMSLLCAKLAEHSDEEGNLANATRYMRTAMRRDSDSVALFVESLTIDDRTRSAMVSQLMHAIDHPADSTIMDIDIEHHDE